MRFRKISIVLAALSVMSLAPAHAQAYAFGIDVSHWNGAIDWTSVALDPQRVTFAVMKATAGRAFDDPTYGQNLTGAVTHAIVPVAYHYAYPDATAGDAIAEADHFVDTAALVDGAVVPALDIEDVSEWPDWTVSKLIGWTRTWLARVLERTGVHALVYTSPSFWSTHLGNTTAVAADGYPLWIANWFASSPKVPASNWNGDGWRAWQFSDAGRVTGIAGSVDLDWLDPQSLQSTMAHGSI